LYWLPPGIQDSTAKTSPSSQDLCLVHRQSDLQAGEPEKGVTITHIPFAGRKAAVLAWRAATLSRLAAKIFRSATKTGRRHEKPAWQ
jgi:hypothetical protein